MTSLSETSLLAGASGQSTGYTIDQSIRFNDNDSPILKKTYSSAGTEETFTFSCWVKRGNLSGGLATSGGATLFSGGASTSNYGEILFRGSSASPGPADCLEFYSSEGGSTNMRLFTNQLFRDTNAWYHIVCVMDTTNAISTERLRIYVNGNRVTDFNATTFPSQNAVPHFNTATEHGVGGFAVSTDTRFFDGYLAEIHFLDGYAYGPEYFGEFKTDTDIWIPKQYTGSYGSNGFKIDGRDSSDLGDDESGNGNDFASSGLASHDQMADSPTNNFAVMNIIDSHTTPNWTASNGNLDISWVGPNYTNPLFSSLSMPPTGKWYFEIKFVSDSNQILYYQAMRIGLMRDDISASDRQNAYNSVDLTDSTTDPEIYLVLGNAGNSCQLKGMGSNIYNVGGSISAGDVINFAREGTNLWVGKNGTYYNSGNPATGSNPSLSNLQLRSYRANMHWTATSTSHGTAVLNAFFGADKSVGSGTGFNNTVPTGFLALNTINLGEA